MARFHRHVFENLGSKPGTGVGWLGKIGFVQMSGKNLFETIMLNMAMLKGGRELWETYSPQWERPVMPNFGTKDGIANDFVDVLTQPFRSLIILRKGYSVTNFACDGGYSFEPRNCFSEQMTLWKAGSGKRNEPVYYMPAGHNPAKKLWREFPLITNADGDAHTPGVVQWISQLQKVKILSKNKQICVKSVGIVYGSSNSSIADTFDDTLSFQVNILDELGKVWRTRITEQINKCETAARYLGELERNLAVAGGLSYSDKTKSTLEKQGETVQGDFYFAIDDPFRRWLRSIDVEEDDLDEKTAEWQESCRALVMAMGRKMVRESGSAALLGHWAEITKGKRELWTSAKAYSRFQRKIWSLYPQTKEEGGELNGKRAGD